MAELNFDSTDVEPNQAFTALPAGEYNAEITDSDMENTKSGTGQFLKLELTVVDGEYAGRKVFDRLNLVNENKQAEEIARRTLSAICHAVGVVKVADSTDLHNRPMKVTIGIEKRKDTGEDANRVKGYASVGEGGPKAFSAPAKPAAAKASTPAKAAPPWASKKQAA